MAERRAVVTSADGLHARPAALFVRAVSDSGVAVRITKLSATQSAANQPSTSQPSPDQSAADQPSTSQPGTDQPSTSRPSTSQLTANQPATDQPNSTQPSADARSILAVLGLDIRQGDEVLLSADGEGAVEALDRLAGMLTEDTDAAA